MELVLQKFFERLHQIIGLNTEAAQREALMHFETWQSERCNSRVLEGLDQASRERYGMFIKQRPQPSPAEIADFWQSLRPGENINALLQNEIHASVQEYVARLLSNASEKQKAEAQKAFKELLGSLGG